jgi:hypothetical protein
VKANRKNTASVLRAASATALALGIIQTPAWAQTANTTGPVLQGTSDGSNNYLNNNPAVTISFSGQTALRNFNTTGGPTLLQPGTSIVLHDGTNGAAVTYTATNTNSTNVQLANPNFASQDYWEDSDGNFYTPGTLDGNGTVQDIQVNSAIQLQWHEQGSIDGFYDLINDEVGYAQNTLQALANNSTAGPISNEALRVPTSSNPTWINTNKFTAAGATNGFTLNNSAADNLSLTYSTNVYNFATGQNILGGQNRIQFSVGEYPTEGFSVGGAASPFAAPGSAGYGLGNTALATSPVALTSLGTGGLRQQFQSTAIANQSTAIDNPVTGTNYLSGPWNTAGANNLTSTNIAATAVTYSANPGTGLLRIDKGDAQWLQTTGRLQNGALFNVVARTVDTGQRVVFAANTGIDPSWAVGSNDDGNSTSTAAANAQHSIGASLRFDGKTSGSEAEKTIAQSRMSLGALSVPEARGASSTAPVRALDIDFNALTDVNVADDTNTAAFVRANFSTIVSSDPNSRYPAVLISHYNTVKTPNATALYNELVALGDVNASNNAINPGNVTSTVDPSLQATAWAQVQSFNPNNLSDPTASGIQGDPTGDVAAYISNIVNSVNSKAATNSTVGGVVINSANDPADALLSNGFLLPGLLDWTRLTDGGTITPVTLNSSAQAQQALAQSNYAPLFTTDGSAAANSNTIGSGATYGAGNTGAPAINGSIPITAKDVTFANGTITSASTASNGDLSAAGGNYLFGNFNQNGVRDYSAVLQSVNAALSLYAADSAVAGTAAASSIYTGATNSTVVTSLAGAVPWVQTGTNKKGDLITLGDYNGDGKFDGQDLYLLATGASLADSTASNTLTATVTNFSDVVRNPNDVLRKNAALIAINGALNSNSYTAGVAFLRKTAAAVLTGTVPSGATDLHTTDPITGLEQFSYDPTGANAFNPGDVNRDGVVDLNDAVLVDQYNGQSYTNLTQSLAATAPAPVTGATEAISLVAVQQVDGESAIGSADITAINSSLSQSTSANWYGYNLQKTGPGTLIWGQTAGAVRVYSGASLQISGGSLQLAGGTLDPFTDNTGGATAGNHVAVALDHGGKLKISGAQRNITVSALSINTASNSQVDVGNGGIAINFASPANDPIASIAGYLKSGYNNGQWTGTAGIISSAAQTTGGPALSVGYADGNTDVGTPAGANQVLVKYTLAGDANLDGLVNFNDLVAVVQNFNKPGTDWATGDFHFGTSTNFTDLVTVVQNFNKVLTFGSSSDGSLTVLPLVGSNSVQLPEPSALALAAAGAGTLLARNRRRQNA